MRIRAYFGILRSPDHSDIRAWSVFARPFRPWDKCGRLVAAAGLSLDFPRKYLWRTAACGAKRPIRDSRLD